ncbi:hypothetical protein C0Q70_01352 [Pomacea canaliculata]|uniref:Uncharacterized protein n=1 Tax=Pomacea canaliculata TaxID=400727 RepID=A0A2T7PZA1_POMCA|nr:hypothetical protein C0Q70_01352 [Pomacea canaliculata]
MASQIETTTEIRADIVVYSADGGDSRKKRPDAIRQKGKGWQEGRSQRFVVITRGEDGEGEAGTSVETAMPTASLCRHTSTDEDGERQALLACLHRRFRGQAKDTTKHSKQWMLTGVSSLTHGHEREDYTNTSHANTSHANTSHANTSHTNTSHANTSHANTSHTISHTNTSHTNTSHTISHTNTSHTNISHTNTSHTNISHTISYANTSHTNTSHTNTALSTPTLYTSSYQFIFRSLYFDV